MVDEWSPSKDDPYGDFDDDDDFNPPWYRRYLIHKLTDEQYSAILERHEKFQRMVGTHTDYNEDGQRGNFRYNTTVTKETVAQYYEESKKEVFPDISPVSPEHIIGWYQW